MRLLGLIALLLFLFSTVEAQRVYKQSRVTNGTIVTDYEYENMPEKKPKGKAYREGGKIKYREEGASSSKKGRAYREGGKIIYR